MQYIKSHGISESSKPTVHESVDLIKLIHLFLHHWYYFVLVLLIFLAGAYLYIRYVASEYKVVATILIEENQQSTGLGAENFMEGFGLRPGTRNLDNQIQILKSWTLIQQALRHLNLGVDYYVKGRISKTSLYPNAPFTVIKDSSGIIPHGIEFAITFFDNENFHIISDKNEYFEINKNAKIGELIENGRIKFLLEKNPNYWNPEFHNTIYYFKSISSESLNNYYLNRLVIDQPSVESTIIELSLTGPTWRKDLDFLNKLIEVFMTTNLNKKNLEANRTVKFIDNQIKGISDSLIIAEDRLQNFRSRNRVMNISEQGSQVLEQAIRFEDEKARLLLEADYYNYLIDYLTAEQTTDQVIAPSTMGVSDQMVVSMVGQLAELQSEYYSLGAGGKNPMQINLSVRIENTKKALLETLRGMIRSNNYAIDENKTRLRQLNRQAEALPATERQLLGIEREFKLNDALYTFLLQKQAEAQIQKASNTSDSEIIDVPRVLSNPIWPKIKLIYFLAIFFGFAIPAIILIIIDALRFKIVSEEDVKKITDIPITGHIIRSKMNYQDIVLKNSNSNVAESFRSLRTRLRFFTKNINSPVILITSSMPGEGKTFTSLNLASAYSIEGKKTILVGFDLRRPKLFDDFNLKNDKGVSTYLIGTGTVNDIIKKTEYPNLDLILAGPIPPNPAELIASKKTNELIEELKARYDFIIIDSAPIGAVSDTYHLVTIADTSLLMVRFKSSLKRLVETTLSEIEASGIHDFGIVLNDIVPRKGYYGYKYGNK